jgi:hypothetical protein
LSATLYSNTQASSLLAFMLNSKHQLQIHKSSIFVL